jgi:hypothetical protein
MHPLWETDAAPRLSERQIRRLAAFAVAINAAAACLMWFAA